MSLYVVATPIGNLGDISIRALDVLELVDLILAEDTRVTRAMLKRFTDRKLNARVERLDEHIRGERLEKIVQEIAAGSDAAIVSSAGTPQVSDPGGSVVEACAKRGVNIIPVPGASALAAILSVADFVVNPSVFIGFLPKKKGRQTLLISLKQASGKHGIKSFVIYESPYRFCHTLEDLSKIFGLKTHLVIGRELTKKFEEVWYGSIQEAQNHFKSPKGEFTILVKSY